MPISFDDGRSGFTSSFNNSTETSDASLSILMGLRDLGEGYIVEIVAERDLFFVSICFRLRLGSKSSSLSSLSFARVMDFLLAVTLDFFGSDLGVTALSITLAFLFDLFFDNQLFFL